jgi:hypothetical protein
VITHNTAARVVFCIFFIFFPLKAYPDLYFRPTLTVADVDFREYTEEGKVFNSDFGTLTGGSLLFGIESQKLKAEFSYKKLSGDLSYWSEIALSKSIISQYEYGIQTSFMLSPDQAQLKYYLISYLGDKNKHRLIQSAGDYFGLDESYNARNIALGIEAFYPHNKNTMLEVSFIARKSYNATASVNFLSENYDGFESRTPNGSIINFSLGYSKRLNKKISLIIELDHEKALSPRSKKQSLFRNGNKLNSFASFPKSEESTTGFNVGLTVNY